MRNIAEIIKDDRNGKQLSQTERQISVAYTQGKYDAVMELKICNNSNAMEVLDKLRAEVEKLQKMCDKNDLNLMAQYSAFGMVLEVIDKYKAESEG